MFHQIRSHEAVVAIKVATCHVLRLYTVFTAWPCEEDISEGKFYLVQLVGLFLLTANKTADFWSGSTPTAVDELYALPNGESYTANTIHK